MGGQPGEVARQRSERVRFAGGVRTAPIHGSAESLVAIVNDILDLSKIEAGKLELEWPQVDLRSVVEDVGAVMGCQAVSKGIDLVLDIADELDVLAYGDAHRLRQCLLNLLGNAVKFTSSGEILVRVNPQGALGEQQLIQFEVADTGMGSTRTRCSRCSSPSCRLIPPSRADSGAPDSDSRSCGGWSR
jgi:two-component system, sensor histidine kinase and response regulator